MRQFQIHRSSPPQAWLLVFVPGLALMLLGVAITIWPRLLTAMVAAVFLLLGVILASFGWRLRRVGSAGWPPFGGMGGSGGLGRFWSDAGRGGPGGPGEP